MKLFYALVEKDEGSAFGVRFPQLPGCFSAADHQDDIVPNAVEALDLWFEDMPHTVPWGFETVRREVEPELKDGAFLIAVPYIRSTGRLARLNISMDQGMVEAIDVAAKQRKLTRSAFLVEAARNEIGARH